jgi:hypothetical protein
MLQQRNTKEPRKIYVVESKVVCVDSVRGGGNTIREIRMLLESTIINLPTMSQSVPMKWVQLLETSREKLCKYRLMDLDVALRKLGLEELKVTKEQALDALQFWDDLGHLKLHTDSAFSCLVTDVPWLIKLLRPLLHHAIVHSLGKACSGKEVLNSCDQEVAGPKCKGLTRGEQNHLLRMAKELQDLNIVRKDLLPYLKHWCDLPDHRAALEILERCLLVTQYSIGGSAPVEWVITCRMKDPYQSLDQTPAIALDQLVKKGPVLCCRADYFLPPGLFSTLQAIQILKMRQSARIFSVLEASSMAFRIVLTDQQQCLSAYVGQLQQIGADDSSEDQMLHQCCLYLQADTFPLFTMLCCDLEGIIRDMFPGFMCSCSILFSHRNTVYEWSINSHPTFRSDHAAVSNSRAGGIQARSRKRQGGLGYMLCYGLNMTMDAEPLALAGLNLMVPQAPSLVETERNVSLHQALCPLTTAAHPFYFLSHINGFDHSISNEVVPVLETATAVQRVLEGVVDLLDAVTVHNVRLSTAGLADEYSCKTAQAVIVFLSPAYLASRLSLRELGMALEASLGRGIPLLAVTVDSQVYECIMRSCHNWAAIRDKWRVAEVTQELVRRRIEDGTIRVWREWEDGSGLPTRDRLEAAKRMFRLVNEASNTKRDQSLQSSSFEVRDSDGVVWLEEKQ